MSKLTPGMSISNRGPESGSLGCFARLTDDPPTVVLLSAAHVLFGNFAKWKNLSIHQPPVKSSCCPTGQIATTLNRWEDGFNDVEVVATFVDKSGKTLEETFRGSETDCAIAKLLAGVEYTNAIPEIGMIKGTPAAGTTGIVVSPQFGTPLKDLKDEHYVRFYSPISKRVYYGTIYPADPVFYRNKDGTKSPLPPGAQGETSSSDDSEREMKTTVGHFTVLPRPTRGETYDPYKGKAVLAFGQVGDSGSVVVNHLDQVIGLLVRAGERKPGVDDDEKDEWTSVKALSHVTPIHRVLERMKIAIPDNLASTKATAGATRVYMPGPDPVEVALDHLAEKLCATRLGRVLVAKVDKHLREARRIVLGHRRALVAWHRHQGPAFVQSCARNLIDPAQPIPTSINGVERVKLLEVTADVLLQYGSASLERDVRRHRDFVLRHLATVRSAEQLVSCIAESPA